MLGFINISILVQARAWCCTFDNASSAVIVRIWVMIIIGVINMTQGDHVLNGVNYAGE